MSTRLDETLRRAHENLQTLSGDAEAFKVAVLFIRSVARNSPSHSEAAAARETLRKIVRLMEAGRRQPRDLEGF